MRCAAPWVPVLPNPCNRFHSLIVTVSVLLLTNWFCASGFAQSRTTCAIGGQVQDESDSRLSGATVKIVSSVLIGGPRTTSTDTQGRFRFSELPAGIYQINVTLKGYQSVRLQGIQASVGMTAEIPIEMTLYAGEETVTVKSETKLIDPTTSSMPTILSQEYLKNIPNDRDTSHILNLAPGINLESAYGGAEESGVSYQIDGVDISDPQGGAPWSFFNYSLIDQVELIGLGAPAEYGQFTGVVFNTVTKSGGNAFTGSMETFYTGAGLTSSNSQFSDLQSTIEQHVEGNVQVAGPVRKDKLWYFAAAQYVHDVSSEGGPNETQNDPRLFLKLTFAANQNNTLEGWLEWDHTKIIGRNGDAFTPLEATTGEDNPELVGNLTWKSILSENSNLSVAWSGYSGNHHFNPFSGFSTPGHVDAQTGFASVNAAQFGIVDRNRNQINASVTHHMSDFIGYHDLKFGTELEYSKVHDRFGYPGNAFFSDNEGPEEDPSTGEDDFFTLAFFGGGYDSRSIRVFESTLIAG
jgi:hypothetical protein